MIPDRPEGQALPELFSHAIYLPNGLIADMVKIGSQGKGDRPHLPDEQPPPYFDFWGNVAGLNQDARKYQANGLKERIKAAASEAKKNRNDKLIGLAREFVSKTTS